MDKAKSKTVIVIVGMPGAGKSLASSVAAKRGVPVFVSGDIIRAEAKRRNLTPSRKNIGRIMLKIREEEGMGAVAKRLRSEEHTSELQSRPHLVCRLLLEKKKKNTTKRRNDN